MRSPAFVISVIAALLLSALHPAFAQRKKQENTANKATRELIQRIVPKHAAYFETEFIPSPTGKDLFEIESKNGKIILRGNNGISIASALNYYLKNYGHCDISWNGSNLNLPELLPQVPYKIKKESPYKYRYYLNYCTFNYSMSWWNWERWQREIDWMALNGINMPLALTGQNIIWDRVYKGLGFTDKDLAGFFSGPAYFNWFWMGNLDGWGGPLPQSWMKNHEALQKKILAYGRALGMTPILPAFTGHVPPAFARKYPSAKIATTSWVGFPEVSILDPNDPMFTEIGKRFLKEEIRTFGTDHLYSSDTFNENTPPTADSMFLNNVSKKIYQSMTDIDPAAKWVMQGWLFYASADFWKPSKIKALLHAIPNDKMIILDLWSESNPVWNKTEAYYGKPWIWCMLHNFGGNISLYGRMNEVASGPSAMLKDPGAGSFAGIGLTPEAIEQNPVMYELMLEHTWRDTPIDIDLWLKDYARRRYGEKNTLAEKAWNVMKKTVYSGNVRSGGPESIISARPCFTKNADYVDTEKYYNPAELLPAWDYLIEAAPALKNSEGFKYDLVDLSRQVLVNYADTLQQLFSVAFAQKDTIAFRKRSKEFLELIGDIDTLLATRKDFLLGVWLGDARKQGTTEREKNLYEKNARNLITLWGDKNSELHEYSCRQWSGMLNGFYKPRWEAFFSFIANAQRENKEPDLAAFRKKIKEWEWQWVNSNEYYDEEPRGNEIERACFYYEKYRTRLRNIYSSK